MDDVDDKKDRKNSSRRGIIITSIQLCQIISNLINLDHTSIGCIDVRINNIIKLKITQTFSILYYIATYKSRNTLSNKIFIRKIV